MLEFDKNGYLTPPQIIETDLETFEQTFVFNDHRRKLFEQFLVFSTELKQFYNKNFFTWIDGSFVTKKKFPNDIDLVLLFDFEFYKINYSKMTIIRDKYDNVDCFFRGLYPAEDPYFYLNELEKFDWFDLFCTDRSDLQKGFVQINF